MKQDIVQSVDRAFSIIEALGTGKKNLVELSNIVDLNKSTVHRLLHTLIHKGYVTQNEETSQYALAPKFLHLGQQIIDDMDIISIAKPYLKSLNEYTGEVVHLVMIEGNFAIYIDKIEAKNNIRMYSYVGKRIPLFSSAVGKAYLTFSNEEEREKRLKHMIGEIEPFTEHTLTTKVALLEDFNQIRERGFSVDREENEYGIICVAAPIYNHLSKIEYAISISTPKFRMDDNKLIDFGKKVVEATEEISDKIGRK